MQATGVLHQSLIEQIYQISWPSRTTRDKAVAFVQSLTRKRHMENTDPLEFTDMACNYFLKKLGGHYRAITKPLLKAGILQSTNYYRPGYYNQELEYVKGQCLSYRINPTLLDDDLVKVIYKGEKKHQKCRDDMTMRSKQIMRQVRIPDMNSRELINFVKRSLTDERIRKMLKVNDEIQEEVVKVKVESSQKEGSRIKCEVSSYRYVKRSELHLRTKCLIKDGKQYHIEHLDTYIKRKRRHLTQAYCDQLLRIKHRNVYADRNDTNLRLDSNLTNLKGDFLSLLQIDGNRLSQIDLKNSQFRFFVMLLEQCERQTIFGSTDEKTLFTKYKDSETAKSEFKVRLRGGKVIEGKPVTLLSSIFSEYCIKKEGLSRSLSKDYKLFRKLVKSGLLYEHIQKIYWAETGVQITRAEAKKIMFTVAFSSYRYCPEGKKVFQKHFPSIVALIDGFKKARIKELGGQLTPALSCEERELTQQEARDTGNASFAVLLQQVESVVFVDKILADCHNRGLKVLSKHDSIVCRQCDKRFVTSLILRTLNSLFGKATYSLDIDGEVFKIRRRRKTRLARVAMGFVHDLFSSTNQANAPPGRVGKYQVESKKYKEEGVSERMARSQKEVGVNPSVLTSPLSSGGRKLSPRVEALRKRIMGG